MFPDDNKNKLTSDIPVHTYRNDDSNQPTDKIAPTFDVDDKIPRKPLALDDDLYKSEIDPIFQKQAADQNKPKENFTQIKTGVYSVLQNQQYVPEKKINPQPEPAANPSPANAPSQSRPIIRTYKSDIQDIMKTDHVSSVNIAIAETEKMRSKIQSSVIEEAKKESNITTVILTISLILVIVAIGIIFLVFSGNTNPATQSQTVTPISLFTAERNQEINVASSTAMMLGTTIRTQIKNSTISVNSVENIFLTQNTTAGKTLLSTSDLVSVLNLTLPDILERSLTSDYMIGFFAFGQNLPFLILKTSSFENAYAGMLQWEKNIRSDLATIFSLPTETVSLTSQTNTKGFEDKVVANNDTRILKDNYGQTILLYSIIGKDTIIISTSEVSFKEVLARLNREKSLSR
ncbi:MAG: hypothetical protein WCO10_01705 [bacterium]